MSTTAKSTIEDRDSYASVLLVLLVDTYGTASLEWLPETIRLQLRDDFGADIPKENEDKLQAAIAIVTTDFFWTNLPRFITITNAINGIEVDGHINVPDVDDVAWAVTEAVLLSPPGQAGNQPPFIDEIRGFVEELLHEEGFSMCPDVLRLVVGNTFDQVDNSDFTDDPDMFAAISAAQQANVQAVQTWLQQRIASLMQQLQSLPLQHGNASNFLHRLRDELKVEHTHAE